MQEEICKVRVNKSETGERKGARKQGFWERARERDREITFGLVFILTFVHFKLRLQHYGSQSGTLLIKWEKKKLNRSTCIEK